MNVPDSLGVGMGKDAALHLDQRFEGMDLMACPHCGELLPGRNAVEAWVESPAVDGWQISYRIAPGSRSPVVAEVRIYPEESESPIHGRWSGQAASVPEGGIPARVMRLLRLTDPIALFDEFVERWRTEFGEEHTREVFHRFGLEPAPQTEPHRTGRAGRSDTFYVRWAAAYVDRLHAGSRRPVKDIAEDPAVWIKGFDKWSPKKKEAAVRAIIHEARRRKLLSAARAGKPGGELSKRSITLLKKMGVADI
ncbi:MAG: hypothetical protein M3P10_03895 [Actinomycetota bacterium]|nr:hypothetical protein [Actinomycetota bacterium]